MECISLFGDSTRMPCFGWCYAFLNVLSFTAIDIWGIAILLEMVMIRIPILGFCICFIIPRNKLRLNTDK